MRLSKTRVNTYLKCPLEFKFKYIDEIDAAPNKYMILGSDVHLIAERFTDKFRDDLDNVNIENELIKIANEEDIGYDLSDHISNLSSFFNEIFVENDYRLFSHEEFLLDEENRFSGICDIILEDDEGNLTVIDYKTSKNNAFSRYRLELCYYKLLVENIFKKPVTNVGVFFTKTGRLRLLEVTDEENKRKYLSYSEIDDAIETLHEVRNDINDAKFYPKKQFLCKFCTYKNICQENGY